MTSHGVVAVINTSPDTVDLLKDAIEQAGFLVVSTFTWQVASGAVNLESFLHTHQPLRGKQPKSFFCFPT